MSDKSEILSEAEVDFLLTAEKAGPTPAPTPPGGDGQAVTMRGDLEQINLADIFQTLGMSKMEGVLRIRNPLEERQVYCRDGHLQVHVPGRLATRRLGQRLVVAGFVQPEQLKAALLEQKKDKRPIGQLLVAHGFVTQEAIDEIVATQVAEDLFALFTWHHGTFEFWKGTPNAAMLELFASCPQYEVNSLLLEVARRSDEWESILATIGSLDDVPKRVRDADPGEEEELGEIHREMFGRANGQVSYRELTEQTTHGLFEVARAARDLVRANLWANIDDAAMVAVAENHAEMGQAKRALVLLQTLRDRPGDRPMGILQTMAKALEKVGERRLAGNLLLEAAQRHTDAATALDLARTARNLCPHDVGTLSFLRTVLVAHAPPDSSELEECTLDLLDAMVEADLVPTALEIIEDARRTGTAQPAILMREVRARQKARDLPGATRVLEELAQLHDAKGETQPALEAYEALLRLDRSRKDVQKLLATRRRTRVGRIVRIVAAVSVLLMVAGMGLVFWKEKQFSHAIATADEEVSAKLAAGDRAGARDRLQFWTGQVGECEALEDLRNRISFAEATEAGRLQKLLRAKVNARLSEAAGHLDQGDVAAALAVYVELMESASLRGEVTEVAQTRVDALVQEIATAAKVLHTRMPPDPATRIERQDLLNGQADLQAICRPTLQRVFEQLDEMVRNAQLPSLLGQERIERITQGVAEGRTAFRRAKEMAAGYAAALARNDQQRQLDPVFKAAVERERAYDFAAALSYYRELERQPVNEGSLRTHFRDRVARNATIVRLLEALRGATAAGDFAGALQQLRALRLSFPDVPFDQIAHVPLRIDSRPAGAKVLCNGEVAGTTPLLLQRLPANSLRIQVEAEGFRSAETVVTGDDPGSWFAHLTLPPARTWRHGSAIEVAPVRTAHGTILADRAGNVTLHDDAGETRWTFRSGDLSGLLTAPCVRDDTVFVGSLDGDLRALDLATGEVQWSLPGMPTEAKPLLLGNLLLVADTAKHLHCVDVVQHARFTLDLAEAAAVLLPTQGQTACVLGERGTLSAIALDTRQVRWQRELPAHGAPQACVVQGTVVVVDDRGHAVGVDAASGDVRWQRDLDGEVLGAPVAIASDAWIATRTHVHRLDAKSGEVRTSLAPDEHEWVGPATAFGNRLVVPVRNGLQVLEPSTSRLLYRLAAGKRARPYVVGSELWVAEADHTVQVFDRLR